MFVYCIAECHFSDLIHDTFLVISYTSQAVMLMYLSYNLLLQVQVHWCEANYVTHNTPNINKLFVFVII
jgi:hypothetical protein